MPLQTIDCRTCEGTGVVEIYDAIQDINPMETETCWKCDGTGIETLLIVEKHSLIWRMLAGIVPGIPQEDATR